MFIAKQVTTRVSQTGINISLDPGEVLFVSGPSGSGKSLLLRTLADLDAHEGEVFFDGSEQSEWLPHEWRKKVVYCPAESAWWGQLVGDHFVHPAQPEQLDILGFNDDVLDWEVSRLSSGEKQRLGLCRVLSMLIKHATSRVVTR